MGTSAVDQNPGTRAFMEFCLLNFPLLNLSGTLGVVGVRYMHFMLLFCDYLRVLKRSRSNVFLAVLIISWISGELVSSIYSRRSCYDTTQTEQEKTVLPLAAAWKRSLSMNRRCAGMLLLLFLTQRHGPGARRISPDETRTDVLKVHLQFKW